MKGSIYNDVDIPYTTFYTHVIKILIHFLLILQGKSREQ